MTWLLKMAWRDSRRNRGRLFLFMSSIVLGIAALVAINSFSENLQKDINSEAKTLLGADLVLEANAALNETTRAFFDTLGGERAAIVDFASMVLFPKGDFTRLAQIKAVKGNYPFYGNLNTIPKSSARSFQAEKQALVDRSMMIQYGAKVGDTIKVGEVNFEIAGEISSASGRAGITSSIAPTVYIPKQYLEQTGLIQFGSRVDYFHYFKFDGTTNPDTLVAQNRERMRALSLRPETVEGRKRGVGEAFSNMATFLNLVGFIALLLGCIGVASSVHIYIKDKLSTVAILRTLGVSGRQAFLIYLIQIFILGVIGSVIGAALGSMIQVVLPAVLDDFLPLQNVSADISISAIWIGIFTGLGIAVLFAMLPLLAIRKTSPLRTLRASFEENTNRDILRWLVFILIGIFIGGFTFLQTGDWQASLFLIVGVGISFLLLAAVARLLMWLVKRFFPTSWSFVWRQGIANLFRPNNQTLILMVSIGLGTALISTLFFMQSLLLKQVQMTGSDNQPNIILFDIQSEQKDKVAQLVKDNEMPLVQQVPIVTMRLDNIDGVTKEVYYKQREAERKEKQEASKKSDENADEENPQRRRGNGWVFNREYRVTYRDTLIDTEKIIEGKWHTEMPDNDTIYISISDRIARNMKAKVGSEITFNVQGTLIETVVSSIREINFNRVQTNFFVVFPTGILEEAPQFHVVVSRVENIEQSAGFQQALVKAFPNVSAIDLTQILKTVDDVLSKVSFVIRFMALFSILTGLLVLISSVVLSKYQRIKESVLLRTLGATGRKILFINAIEYFLLGTLASLTGIGLAFVASYLLAVFSFEIPYQPDFRPAILLWFSITALTVIIGLFNSREVLSQPPLEVLRKEV